MARKPAEKLTDEQVARRLFPPEVRKWLKEKLLEADKPKKPAKKQRKP